MNNFKHIVLLSVLCSLLLSTNCGEDKRDAPVKSLIYFAENDKTVKAIENVHLIIGKSYILEEKTYLVVDSAMLYEMVVNNEDVSRVVTTYVKNMSGLFAEIKLFNQDINSWDVSNVEDMSLMFSQAKSFNQDISSWDVSNVTDMSLSLIHICRCRRIERCRSRWWPYH